jgi:hypothetical protein
MKQWYEYKWDGKMAKGQLGILWLSLSIICILILQHDLKPKILEGIWVPTLKKVLPNIVTQSLPTPTSNQNTSPYFWV